MHRFLLDLATQQPDLGRVKTEKLLNSQCQRHIDGALQADARNSDGQGGDRLAGMAVAQGLRQTHQLAGHGRIATDSIRNLFQAGTGILCQIAHLQRHLRQTGQHQGIVLQLLLQTDTDGGEDRVQVHSKLHLKKYDVIIKGSHGTSWQAGVSKIVGAGKPNVIIRLAPGCLLL